MLRKLFYVAILLPLGAMVILRAVSWVELLTFERSSLVNREMIRSAMQTTTLSGPDVFTDDVAFVCNFGPYALGVLHTTDADVDKRHADLMTFLADMGLFPIDDGKGVFVYFDSEKRYLGADEFSEHRGRLRWRHPGPHLYAEFCARRSAVRLTIMPEARVRYLRLWVQ